MRIAYLIDSDSVGGGMEYVRRKIARNAERAGGEARVFFADRGECRPAAVDAWRPDLVHVNHLRALLQLLANPFRRPAAPVVFTVHGVHLRKYDFLPKTPLNRIKRFLRRSLEAYLYRRCASLIALTETDAQYIRKTYGRNLDVRVEPNEIDEAELRSLDFVEGSFAYVCIGRFDFQKGQDRWLGHVAKHAREFRAKGLTTLFVGGGKTLAECRAFAEEKGIGDLVRFEGERQCAERYLKSARTVVSPSRWEGMPYLLMKARALGCDILATDCPGNREVLEGYAKWKVLDFAE